MVASPRFPGPSPLFCGLTAVSVPQVELQVWAGEALESRAVMFGAWGRSWAGCHEQFLISHRQEKFQPHQPPLSCLGTFMLACLSGILLFTEGNL